MAAIFMKKIFLIAGASLLIASAIYTQYNRGRKASEYFGRWYTNGFEGDMEADLYISRAGEDLVVLWFSSKKEGVYFETEFCTYKDGCFFSCRNKKPIACELDNFQIALNGDVYGYAGQTLGAPKRKKPKKNSGGFPTFPKLFERGYYEE